MFILFLVSGVACGRSRKLIVLTTTGPYFYAQYLLQLASGFAYRSLANGMSVKKLSLLTFQPDLLIVLVMRFPTNIIRKYILSLWLFARINLKIVCKKCSCIDKFINLYPIFCGFIGNILPKFASSPECLNHFFKGYLFINIVSFLTFFTNSSKTCRIGAKLPLATRLCLVLFSSNLTA